MFNEMLKRKEAEEEGKRLLKRCIERYDKDFEHALSVHHAVGFLTRTYPNIMAALLSDPKVIHRYEEADGGYVLLTLTRYVDDSEDSPDFSFSFHIEGKRGLILDPFERNHWVTPDELEFAKWIDSCFFNCSVDPAEYRGADYGND